jgi:hypothetical protein
LLPFNQRARDNGLPDYNTMRVAYGLPPVTSFAQITNNVQVQQELAQAYPGGVNTIDAFEGGLAEDHVPGSDVGPLFQAIMVNQFTCLRDGDHFFYLNEHWTPDELRIFQQGNTLAKVIEANTGETNLQNNVFLFKASISGTVSATQSGNDHRGSMARGLSGVTVELQDTSGNVVATTFTDNQGRYNFNQLNGVSATRDYTVRLIVPSGLTQTSANPSTISISRGDLNVRGVNFLLTPASSVTSASATQAMSSASTASAGTSLDLSAVDALFAEMSRGN